MERKLPNTLKRLIGKISLELSKLNEARENIKSDLSRHADGKPLKGDEIVGWIGEVYGKLLLNGVLVGDEYEHDFEAGNMKVSVKARKGNKRGWTRTSAIPKIMGKGCPTHLMFIHLADNHSLQEVWLYPWEEILKANRFKSHKVRGEHRSYIFNVSPKKDIKYLIYKSM